MRPAMTKIALSKNMSTTSTTVGDLDIYKCTEGEFIKLRITHPDGSAEFNSTVKKVYNLILTANQYLDNIGARNVEIDWTDSEWLYNLDNSSLITFCRRNKIHLMDCVVNTSRFMNNAPNSDISNRTTLMTRYSDLFRDIDDLNAVEIIFSSLLLSRMHLDEAKHPSTIIKGIIDSYNSKDLNVEDIYITSKRLYTYISLLVDMMPDSEYWCDRINEVYSVDKAPEDYGRMCSITSILRSVTLDRFTNTLIEISNDKNW